MRNKTEERKTKRKAETENEAKTEAKRPERLERRHMLSCVCRGDRRAKNSRSLHSNQTTIVGIRRCPHTEGRL